MIGFEQISPFIRYNRIQGALRTILGDGANILDKQAKELGASTQHPAMAIAEFHLHAASLGLPMYRIFAETKKRFA